MTNETDEELYLRLKRWGKMSMRDIQKEILFPKYGRPVKRDWPYDGRGKKLTRVAESACPRCGDHVRTPCRLAQYLETCVGCGERIGDTPAGI
ncbi:MAG: hypothetical protein CMA60_05655 [Euryarchaeota archaeon]|nr:hypothetical protein [Euryarchaeota archaeon]